MSKDDVIAALRSHQAELNSAGVLRLSVFGGRPGEAGPESDVDLSASDRKKRICLFEAVEMENRLSEILGSEADLWFAGMLNPDIQERFDREADLPFRATRQWRRISSKRSGGSKAIPRAWILKVFVNRP